MEQITRDTIQFIQFSGNPKQYYLVVIMYKPWRICEYDCMFVLLWLTPRTAFCGDFVDTSVRPLHDVVDADVPA